jgi:hydrogenase nickel incorporation protein HypA/HybF
MHELSVCLSLLEQVQAIAAERNAVQVTRIELKVGPLSGVESALLHSAWPMAAAGTIATDADFVIEEAGIIVRCSICNAETDAQPNRLVCGACGDYRTAVVSGEEMILQSVELETAQ